MVEGKFGWRENFNDANSLIGGGMPIMLGNDDSEGGNHAAEPSSSERRTKILYTVHVDKKNFADSKNQREQSKTATRR